MKIRATHKCYGCKEVFRNADMVEYAALGTVTKHWYCQKCYADKLARERFSDKIRSIFGKESPGPQIWKERQDLFNKYGYTDDIIIDCLDYIYNVQHIEKKKPTLFFVKPPMVDKMKQYKRAQQAVSMQLAQATQQETYEHIVPVKENTINNNKIVYDPDEWLGD